jgi:hypothetical protein
MSGEKVPVQKKDRLKQAFAAARKTGNVPNLGWKSQGKAAYREFKDASG